MDISGLTGDLFALPVPAAPSPAPATPVAATTVPVRPPPALVAASRAAPAPRQLWIALSLPLLALSPDTPHDVPVVVVEDERGRPTVVACNALAARQGVSVGLGLETALALAPELGVQRRTPSLEARRLEEVARLAMGFTPLVCVEAPDGLLLEVRGSRRLFGGLAALLGRLRTELARRHCAARLGIAPTPRAAVWLARAGDEQPVESPILLGGRLNALPLAVTRWPAATQEALARLGLRRLGDLVRLPRAGVARRYTTAVLAELDEAYGRLPAVRRHYRVPERFATALDLEAEIGNQALLEPALRRLLDDLGRFLEVRAAGVSACSIRFTHRGRAPTVLTLRRSELAGGGGDWHRLLYEHLARLKLPAAVTALSLRSGVLVPLPAASRLLPGLADPAATGAEGEWLIDRLKARLGEAAVTGLCLVEEHRPEGATRRIRPTLTRQAAERRGLLPSARRPLWLLAEPRPLTVRAGRPWLDGGLVLESGPERIESGWWDGSEIARDYYVARLAGQARLWLYRELGDGEPRWFWHGVYA